MTDLPIWAPNSCGPLYLILELTIFLIYIQTFLSLAPHLQSHIIIYIYFLYQGFLKMIQRKMCEIEIIAIPAYTLSILAVLPFKWTQRHLPLTFHTSLIQTLSISPHWPMSFCCESIFCRDPYVSQWMRMLRHMWDVGICVNGDLEW